jgi:hypothetical protein
MATDATSVTWSEPFEAVRRAVADDEPWAAVLGSPGSELPRAGVHMAVFVEPYLGYVLDGSKSVESRFSATRCAPYGRVRAGDVLLLKRSGGPVVGLGLVKAVWSYQLDPESWRVIRESFAAALRAQNPDFWESRRGAEYATLMSLERVRAVGPIQWKKADRRGWVVLREADPATLF